MPRHTLLHPIRWTFFHLLAALLPAAQASAAPEGGAGALVVAATLFVALAIPTFWLSSIFDLASSARLQGGAGRWWFVLPPSLIAIGQGISVASMDHQSVVAVIGSFIALAGLVSYLVCLWKASGALILADSADGTISAWQRFSILLALFYTIVGVWVLQGKFSRVAAKAPS